MLMSNVLRMTLPTKMGAQFDSVFISDSCIGVEIEMETMNTGLLDRLSRWSRVREGSIEGWEIVLREPSYHDSLFLALNELVQLEELETPTVFTERTSVHVHVDVRDMTAIQFMNFVTLAIMFEPVFYKYVAEHRSGNHFCWSTLDCQSIISKLVSVYKAISRGESSMRDTLVSAFHLESTKYSGINLSSVPRYGSLEFRMHEGTCSPQKIIRWINILMSLKNYAMDEGRTPLNILTTKEEVGIDSIFTAVLGSYRGILSYDGVDKDILKGIRSAQDFVKLIEAPSLQVPDGDRSILARLLNSCSSDFLHSRGTEYASSNLNRQPSV